MPKRTEYRLLERWSGDAWQAFGIAYDRAGTMTLFCPAWRSQRRLTGSSLAELGSDDFPPGESAFRWGPVVVGRLNVKHPVELLAEVLSTDPAIGAQASSMAEVLTAMFWKHLPARSRVRGGQPVQEPEEEFLERIGRIDLDPAFRGAMADFLEAFESA